MTWTQLNIKPGVVRRATPYDSPNSWWATSNVRWVSGAMCPVGGNQRITDPIANRIRKLFQWRDNDNNIWLAVGHEAGVRVEYGGYYNVTPAGFVSISEVTSSSGFGGFGLGPYDDVSPVPDTSGVNVVRSDAVEISIASPAVVTWINHGLTGDDVVEFSTNGVLPTGVSENTLYYVIPTGADTFHICSIIGGKGGTPIDTTGAQSGDHTGSWIVGQDTYGRQRSTNAPQYRRPDFWTFASFGQDLLACCSSDGRLLHLPTEGGVATTMVVPSNAPVSNTAVLVSSERSAILLGADGNKRRVAWSDFEDFNGWNFNSPIGQAGYIDIEATSPIVSGIRVKEGILILTQHEAFLMRYVGAPYYYGIEKLGTTSFSTPNAIASGSNMAIWFGEESFYVYDGSSVRPIDCPFFNDLKIDFDPIYGNFRAHMHENGLFPEFWFDYPDKLQTDGECNHYVIFNYAEGWWARGDRSRTAAIGAQTAKFPLAAAKDNAVYQHEDGWTDAGVSRVGNVWAESSTIDFGQAGQIWDINQALVPVDPEYGSSNYSLRFKSRFAGDQPESTFGPYLPRADGYTDCRASGRDIRLRLEATTDTYWSIGPVRLEVEARGGFR